MLLGDGAREWCAGQAIAGQRRKRGRINTPKVAIRKELRCKLGLMHDKLVGGCVNPPNTDAGIAHWRSPHGGASLPPLRKAVGFSGALPLYT